MHRAALAWMGSPVPNIDHWSMGFEKNPDEVEVLPNVLIHLQMPEDYINYQRSMTTSSGKQYAQYKLSRKGQSSTFTEELAFQKAQLLIEGFPTTEVWERVKNDLGDLWDSLSSSMVMSKQLNILTVVAQSSNPSGFWDSDLVHESDFLHIRTSLMAADIFYFPDSNPPSPSLQNDFEIVAAALPYVDIMTTDAYIKELMSQSGLIDQYSAKVFSMKRNDRRALLDEIDGRAV